MHELSLCRSVESIIRKAVPDRRVTVIRLDVGEWRQVIPETMITCWGWVSEDAPLLAGSELAITVVPAVLRCRDCGAETRQRLPVFRCEACGSVRCDLISGEEFLVRSVDVAERPSGPPLSASDPAEEDPVGAPSEEAG
ncbi:MAG: hydrogenase maturation nickel metallochaperone HypA [Propionibacteriaceae bacterium]|jgi:hydrogenase nickel incorporation protein HypA/HybF|nr:hydrogenase maturation nickel metallochaperone HypA [Propionibacteriaceae bacterium]